MKIFIVSAGEFDGWENEIYSNAYPFKTADEAAKFINDERDDLAVELFDEDDMDECPARVKTEEIKDGAKFGFPEVENRYFCWKVGVFEV